MESMQSVRSHWWAMSGNNNSIFLQEMLHATSCRPQHACSSNSSCQLQHAGVANQGIHNCLHAHFRATLWHGDVVAAV